MACSDFTHYFFFGRYDAEVTYFDENVRNAKREYLESKALQVSVATCKWLS